MSHAQPKHLISREDHETKAETSGYPGWVYRLIAPFAGRRVCDLGCGHGSVSQHFAGRERLVCVDMSDDAIASLKDRFAGRANVAVVQADLTATDFSFLTENKIDTVISNNVFEHLDDPESVAKKIFDRLPVGGRLILMVPAHEWLYCEIDRMCHHKRRYTQKTLRALLSDAGFDVAHCRGFNLPGVPVYWYKGFVKKQSAGFFEDLDPKASGKIAKFIKYYSAIEKYIPFVPGLSLLAVGEKK